jgi:hypothetical protein
MLATLQKFSSERIIDPNHEYLNNCSYCDQQYLLAWDGKEWNSVKDWIRVAAFAVRKTHPRCDLVQLPSTSKV